jgi:DNA-binding transcriptional regulator YdaS (Cro superfamily)
MHFASTLLQTALHWLSPQGHAVIQQLVATQGYAGSAHEIAVAVGLRNRFQLSRLLDREGLPSLENLAAWIRVMIWALEWETSKTSLSQSALGAIRDPAACYRTVERVTGLTWNKVRSLGSSWVLLAFVECCHGNSVGHAETGARSIA